MSVHFDRLDEFLVELERDAVDGEVQNAIVRRVTRRRLDTATVPLYSTVVGYIARGQVIEVEIGRGKVWGGSLEESWGPETKERDRQVLDQIDVDAKAIEDFCAQHALDLRGGSFR